MISSFAALNDETFHISLTVIDLAAYLHRLDVFLSLPVPECTGADVEFLQHLRLGQKFLLRLFHHWFEQLFGGLLDDAVGKFYKIFDKDVERDTGNTALYEFN